MKIPKLYALYSETRSCFMGLDLTAGEFEESPIVEFSLSKYFANDTLWTTADKDTAQSVIDNPSVSWFNTSPTHPQWNKGYYGNLKIVEIN